jgi:hypothetical protein
MMRFGGSGWLVYGRLNAKTAIVDIGPDGHGREAWR